MFPTNVSLGNKKKVLDCVSIYLFHTVLGGYFFFSKKRHREGDIFFKTCDFLTLAIKDTCCLHKA